MAETIDLGNIIDLGLLNLGAISLHGGDFNIDFNMDFLVIGRDV